MTVEIDQTPERLAAGLLAIREGLYSSEHQVVGGASAAMRAERHLLHLAPDYKLLMSGQLLRSRVHVNGGLNSGEYRNQHQMITRRVGRLSLEQMLAFERRLSRTLGLISALPESLVGVRRLAAFLPFPLPIDQSVWSVLRYIAGQPSVPKEEMSSNRLKDAKNVMVELDNRVLRKLEEDPRVLISLNNGIKGEVDEMVQAIIERDDRVVIEQAKEVLIQRKIRRLKAQVIGGKGEFKSAYVRLVNQAISGEDLDSQIEEVSEAQQEEREAYKAELLPKLAEERARKRRLSQLQIVRSLDSKLNGEMAVPAVQSESEVVKFLRRTAQGAEMVISEAVRVEWEIQDLAEVYQQIPDDPKDPEFEEQSNLYKQACQEILTPGEYARLKPLIESSSRRQLIYRLGKRRVEEQLRRELTSDEIAQALREVVARKVIHKRGLIRSPVVYAVDRVLQLAGLGSDTVLSNPEGVAKVADEVVRNATRITLKLVRKRTEQENHDDQLRGEIPRVRWTITKPLLLRLGGSDPASEFARVVLTDVAIGANRGIVAHDPQDLEVLARTLGRSQAELHLGAMSCPDWGWHYEETVPGHRVVVFDMDQLGCGVPRTAQTLLVYMERVSKLAKGLSRPTHFIMALPAIEVNRQPLLEVNGGISSDQALELLAKTAEVVDDELKGLENDYFHSELKIFNPDGFHSRVRNRQVALIRTQRGKLESLLKIRPQFYNGDINLAARDLAEHQLGFRWLTGISDIVVVSTSPTLARLCLSRGGAGWIQLSHGYRG